MKWTKETIIQLLKDLEIGPRTDDWEIHHRLSMKNLGREVKVTSGASKICLIFPGVPFVIKWSTGDFGEAMKEVSIYQDAIQFHLEKFFPRTEHLVTIKAVDFVLQEKIDCAVGECSRYQEQKFDRIGKTASIKIMRKMEKEFQKASGGGWGRSLDARWAKVALVIYGKRACKTLCDFIVKHNINDLHENNIGYKNGKPIILDFSGYNR